MKIIVASCSKCGTKTLNAALTQLGFKVYDFLENFWYFEKEWKDILATGKTNPKVLKEMYSQIDAVVDAPAYMFWKDLHHAFPDAKIILTVRDEEEWFISFQKQVDNMVNNTLFKVILTLAPSGKRLFSYMNAIGKYHMNVSCSSAWAKPDIRPVEVKENYRKHNQDVLKNAPSESLLVLNLKDGWGPLCEFLDVDVPPVVFPHKNIGGELINTWIHEHPFVIRMKKEAYAIMTGAVLFCLTAAATAVCLSVF